MNFFYGKSILGHGKVVVANGGGFEKSSGNQSTQVWEILNDHVKSRRDISSEKQFPN